MRGKRLAAAVLAFSLLVAAWIPGAFADEGALQVVEAEGAAAVIDQNLAQARSEAVRIALQNAVAAVAERLLPSHRSSPGRALPEKLFERSEAHILDFRILSESSAPEIYTVTVRVTVSEEGLRGDLQRLGLAEPARGGQVVTRVVLKVLGIRDYGDYLRCQRVVRAQIPGLRQLTVREAQWGTLRFDMDAEGTAESLGRHLRETAVFEVLHQDPRRLEVYLR